MLTNCHSDPLGTNYSEIWIKAQKNFIKKTKLQQLERLRSEDTPRRPMITHTIDQFISDPKSKQGESRKIRQICEKLKF